MGRKVIKKQDNKRVPSKAETNHTNALNPWPDLPQKLIKAMSRQFNSLMLDASYGGVTKSWKAQTKQCNSQAILLPWLEIYHGWNSRHWRQWPWQPSGRDYVGCFGGLLIMKAVSSTDYYLHFYRRGQCYGNLPPWDVKVPFQRAVVFSLTKDPDWTGSVFMILTGISHPAFMFYRKNAGAKYAWIKQDCNIPDPQNCFSKSDQKQTNLMRFTNAIGFKGKFYALSLQGTLAVIEDIDSDQPRMTALGSKRAVPSVSSRHFKEFLLESDGEILLVFLISKKSVNIVDDVEVFRLDVGTLSWIKMERIGDRTLFLGSNCCISVSASKMRCRSDCVYFSHHTSEDWWVYDLQRGNISLCRSDESLPQELLGDPRNNRRNNY